MPFQPSKFRQDLRKITRHSLFKNSVLYTLTDAINKAIPFLLLPLLTHYLVPAEYGIVSNFSVYTSVLLIFIGLSLQGAISVNYYKLSKKQLAEYISNVISITFFTAIICSVLVLIFSPQIINTLHIPVNYLLAGILIALSQSFTAINLTLWQLEEKAIKYGIYEITQTALNISLSLLFIISYSLGWRGRLDGFFIAACSYGLFSLYILYDRGYFTLSIQKAYLKDAVFFSLPLLPHSLSIWIRSGIDRIYISKLIGEAATGIYATGFQFGLLVSFITMAFNNAYVPYLFKSLSIEDEHVLKRTKLKLAKFTYLYLLLLVISCVVLIGMSILLVNNFLSAKYLESKWFIPWAILAQTFQGMYLMFVNYIYFVKKTRLLAYITFICSLLQVVLSYILIKHFGAIGAAYSTTLISFINFVAVWIYSARAYDMPWTLSH
ncbi:lipopolysaccharide biosynthesis protein [Mucilaginibacter sp. L3T2-6]|uniref:lipopolysaccharide biosynthesis protein n=1 Tax=Mucilaginibacter sp. L3T2-6 TaxID=3062491 RepID=UPI002674C1DA|nr:oligosaccharide flippase family protein [Mucilaginibacter sp. L3T2-6]MDO3642472.1 oligosaccharide flippase family protein [Mucilaginibacter sp. L3T2-6]MDV6215132.1 oligosaccharide flippase family protein [Mucilaginibacter sp. L3T2-6]